MTKQFKFVKIICIVLVIAILALAFAVGFLAISILRNSHGPDPLEGYEEKIDPPIIPPIKNDSNTLLPYIVRSDQASDAVYLRGTAYGSYNGKEWLAAIPYTELIDDKYPAYYLGVKQIEAWNLSNPIALEIVPNSAPMVNPAYTATKVFDEPYEEEYVIPIDDVTANGKGTEYYRMYYYGYDDASLKPMVPIFEYQSYEAHYRDFVKQHYLEIDEATKEYMLKIAEEQLFAVDDYELPEKIAEYVIDIGVYSLEYDTNLDQEENVPISFIEEYKEGTCKHFATVATLLFRALNIPARYVVGYMTETIPGEWVQVTNLDAHAWVEFYVDGFGWKMLEVTPQRLDTELTVKPKDVDKLFDGTPLYPSSRVEGLEEYEENGYTYEAVISGERTDPGTTESKIESLKIFDQNGKDVTSKFTFTFETGKVTVYAGIFSLESNDFTYRYNGKSPISQLENCKAIFIEGVELPLDCNIGIIARELPSEIGNHPHSFDISITDANGQDITGLYKYVYNFGSVKVDANVLVLQAGSASKLLDGTELTCNEISIVEGALVEGDEIAEFKVIGSQVALGTSANVIDLSSIVIKNSLGEVVTSNYLLSARDGTLTVYLEE